MGPLLTIIRAMKSATKLSLLGLILGIVAVVGFLADAESAGEGESIVSALSTDSTSKTLSPRTTTSSILEASESPEPRWAPNDSTLLTQLSTAAVPVPAGLRVAVLGIDAPIGSYGVDGTGQMDVPDNVSDVGWYKYGPRPGEPGSAVLAAHVDLAGPGRGVFYELGELNPGDQITVEYSDGSEMVFDVVARSTYRKSELPLDSIFSESGPAVLTLITCGGGFSQSSRSYDSNVVVFAVPEGGADVSSPIS